MLKSKRNGRGEKYATYFTSLSERKGQRGKIKLQKLFRAANERTLLRAVIILVHKSRIKKESIEN